MRLRVLLVVAIGLMAPHEPAAAHTLTGTLAGIVTDGQGGVVEGATVRVTSQLLGWEQSQKTNRQGQLRFPALPPGEYALDVEAPGFATYREEGVRTFVKPFETTLRRHASVPAMTFGHLTHTISPSTVWDMRVGRFVFDRSDDPSTGNVTTPSRFDSATAGHTTLVSVVDPKRNLGLDPGTRAPHTDEYSVGIDREFRWGLSVATAYIHKHGRNFIGWTDVGGQYRQNTYSLSDGRVLPVFVLVNSTADRRFVLTNPAEYSLAYDGVVIAADKRRSNGWQAFASYTFAKASGLQVSSGATAAASQVSTILGAALPHVRAGSEQPHERARPLAERSAAPAARHGQRGRASHGVRRCREPSAPDR